MYAGTISDAREPPETSEIRWDPSWLQSLAFDGIRRPPVASTDLPVLGSGCRHQPMPFTADQPVATSAHITGCMAVRRARRAGLTGSVRRVADPFRRGLGEIFNGTVTGRIAAPTAVEITAVDRHFTGDGSEDVEHLNLRPFWCGNDRSTSPVICTLASEFRVCLHVFPVLSLALRKSLVADPVASAVTAVPSSVPFRGAFGLPRDGTVTGRIWPLHTSAAAAERSSLLLKIYAPFSGMNTKSDTYQELTHSGKVWEDCFQSGDSERHGCTKLQQARKFRGWRQSMNLGAHVKTLVADYAHQSVAIENNKLELSTSRQIEDLLLKTPQETSCLVSMSIRDLSGSTNELELNKVWVRTNYAGIPIFYLSVPPDSLPRTTLMSEYPQGTPVDPSGLG
ncbi:hypothetical protein DFH08DRAFT_822107 [Mycena albidolilacea]|uniref:Uncharacterized protein n=1 Tax=Mycena albidolilacea TaxID=1033008 RepID=A0AAD6Z8D4_9AGAR|nr:hypothetical protein DFH08DRAFT_822107 [Mycena albidolilacea]